MGFVAFNQGPDAAERERLVRAGDACPVDALTVLDEDGKQLAP